MKKLMIFAAGLLLSLSARSQILKPVKWSYAAKKTSATTATVFIKATIQEGWHVYGLTVPEGGPIKTTFTFTPSNSFSTTGAIIAPKPTVKFEKTFNMNVNFFEKEVIFQQKVKLKGAEAEVKGTVEFMVCSDRQCLPPETTAFSIPVK
jgi:hypothetical protein